jgi:transposase InsO family protein
MWLQKNGDARRKARGRRSFAQQFPCERTAGVCGTSHGSKLAIVDDFRRECLALIADTSLPGLQVVRELTAVAAWRGRPVMCVSDNGSELTGMAVLRWSQEMQIEWHYIAPGKPT